MGCLSPFGADGHACYPAGSFVYAVRELSARPTAAALPCAFSRVLLPCPAAGDLYCRKHPEQYRSLVRSFTEHCLHSHAPPESWI